MPEAINTTTSALRWRLARAIHEQGAFKLTDLALTRRLRRGEAGARYIVEAMVMLHFGDAGDKTVGASYFIYFDGPADFPSSSFAVKLDRDVLAPDSLADYGVEVGGRRARRIGWTPPNAREVVRELRRIDAAMGARPSRTPRVTTSEHPWRVADSIRDHARDWSLGSMSFAREFSTRDGALVSCHSSLSSRPEGNYVEQVHIDSAADVDEQAR
ncbi:MAG TPA: hypothetical protein VGO62_07250, partial [Myxococcota bacterium]